MEGKRKKRMGEGDPLDIDREGVSIDQSVVMNGISSLVR